MPNKQRRDGGERQHRAQLVADVETLGHLDPAIAGAAGRTRASCRASSVLVAEPGASGANGKTGADALRMRRREPSPRTWNAIFVS